METTTPDPAQPERLARYLAYFGEAGAKKYLAKFERFEAGGRPLSWNWAACLCTFGWLIYRRMGWLALLYLPFSIPGVLFVNSAQRSDACGYALRHAGDGYEITTGLYLAFVFLVVPAFADYVHYRIVRRRLAAEATPTPPRWGLRRAAAAVAVLIAAALWTLPVTYVDARTQRRISGAYEELQGNKVALSEAWQDLGHFPDKPADVLHPADPNTGTIAMDATGTTTLTLNFPPVAGRRLVITPKIADSHIDWSCASPDLPDACVPRQCRREPR